MDEHIGMVDEAMDEMAEEEGEEEDAMATVQQVLEEIGIDSAVVIPRTVASIKQPPDGDYSDIDARLARLKSERLN